MTWKLTGKTTGSGETTLDGVRFNIGETVVTWYATDDAGNVDSCKYTVTVADTTKPCFGCDPTYPSCETIGNQEKPNDAGETFYTHSGTDWDAQASDNSGIDPKMTWKLTGVTEKDGENNSSLNGVQFNLGETTVTWYATDEYGNVDSCKFTVTVKDTEPPCIGCNGLPSCETIGLQMRSTDAGVNTYAHSGTDWDVKATDNSGEEPAMSWILTGATKAEGQTTLDGITFHLGTTTVTWIATDAAGNADTCFFKVMVNDEERPVITAPEDIVTTCADELPEPYASYADFEQAGGVATDNDVINTASFAMTKEVSDGNKCPEVITRTYYIEDRTGLPATCEQTITIKDTIAPEFSAPADITLCRDENGEISADTDVTGTVANASGTGTSTSTSATGNASVTSGNVTYATDNCSDELDITWKDTDTTGTDAEERVITREWTVTDDCGNDSTLTQRITIRPSILTDGNYELTCISDTTVVLPYNTDRQKLALPEPTAINNMTGMEVVLSNDYPADSVFVVGTTTITWTATDECGHSLSCSYDVVVEYPACGDSVADGNGYRYSSVRIGSQCWTGENARTTLYTDGSEVANYSNYDRNEAYDEAYGKLYSWYSAVKVAEGDNSAEPELSTVPQIRNLGGSGIMPVPATPGSQFVQGICPEGWAIPTGNDFAVLFETAQTMDKVKDSNSEYWLPGYEGTEPNTGFNARGAGYYSQTLDKYFNLRGETYFWTCDKPGDSSNATCAVIKYHCSDGMIQNQDKGRGQSVRCIRMY